MFLQVKEKLHVHCFKTPEGAVSVYNEQIGIQHPERYLVVVLLRLPVGMQLCTDNVGEYTLKITWSV